MTSTVDSTLLLSATPPTNETTSTIAADPILITSDDIIIGILMSITSIICIIPNVVVMHAIKSDKELFRLNAYKFMFVLNIFDILQLIVHFITGFFNIFQTVGNHTFAKMLGAIATPSYVTYAVLTVILSVNRLTQICLPYYDQYLFSPNAMKGWIVVSLMFFFSFAMALASPWATIIYLPEYWSWDYEKSDDYPGSFYVQHVEMVIEIGGIPVSGIIYIIVFVTLIKKRRQYTLGGSHSAEMKILAQAVTITVYCSILNIFWHNYQVLLPSTRLAYSCLNFMWIINGAVNPVIYYIVNTYVRKRRVAPSVPVAQKTQQKTMHPGLTTTIITGKHGTT